ncbi:hypothetical protein LSTR_LSTR013731 [Laodelphax striatellus]|uniref:Uncharacterized protein n=1 Tax=Laodelphax striatellus TaxID=195883 RepID=A0A482WVE3_LAOST|nr:hypothetical protein LSTR_LSTR013731 [Laodelphax striatellus]
MKASAAALTLVFLALAVFHCSEAKIDKAKKEAAIKKCQAETSASDEDVKKVRKEHVVPESEEGKAMLYRLWIQHLRHAISGLNECHVAAKYFACLQRHPDFVKMKEDFDV